jgi:PAS domain S-box-containing protein
MDVEAIRDRSYWFQVHMKELGYEDGSNMELIVLKAKGNYQLAESLLKDAVKKRNPDLVVSNATMASQTAAKLLAGTDIPQLFFTVSDPVGAGLVKSIGTATGKNITGRVHSITREIKIKLVLRLVEGKIKTRPIRFGYIYSTYPSSMGDLHHLKKIAYLSNYRYLRIVLESYTAESLHQNYQLLKEAKMDQVVSYVESYQQEAINKAKILTKVRGGHIMIFNNSGKLISCTRGFNSATVESAWKKISKKIVSEDTTKIIEGHIKKKPYDDVYVAQYFKPWNWVVFYSIPDEDIRVLVNKIRMIILGIIFLCAIVSSFLIFIFCKKYLLRPIAKLKDAAQSIADHENIETISIFSTDELGVLARSMETMSKSINLYKTEQKKAKEALIEKHTELQKSQFQLKRHQDSLEQLVDERTVELRKSEKRFKTMIAKSPLPMTITDKNQNMVLFNDKFTQLFGYTLEEVSTAEKWWKRAYPDEEYRTKVQNSWRIAIEKAKANKTDIEMQEWELTIKDITKRSCEFYMVPLEDVSLIVVNDITERKKNISDRLKLETKLRQAQKMESIGNLAGGIAHDFNNILSSIIGFTELALGEAEKGTELEDDLKEVHMAGLRAKDLVKQILVFARKSDEAVKPIQVNVIAKEVLNFIKASIPTTIQIKDKIISDSIVMGSSTQFHQVFMNLCTNAAQAMEEKGGILEVSVNDTTIGRNGIPDLKPGEYIEIKVSDTGMGIFPQHIHTIFEPYFTTKAVGEGTGMGLAVVHGIVEDHGGKITVDTTLGKGTCFTIYLPITKKRKVHSHSEKKELPVGTENILFVDDEASIAKMGSKVLEQLGYTVTTRTSSADALELFRSKPQAFDLIITDMTMPNMTGDKMAAEMMNIRANISVILCTEYSKKLSEESSAKTGIKAFAYKPIVKADLAKTVQKVLDET